MRQSEEDEDGTSARHFTNRSNLESISSSDAPLLGNSQEELETSRTNQIATQEADEPSLDRISKFLWLLSCSAGLGGLLFGYDTGVISSTLVSIKSDLGKELTTLDKSLITSITSLAALFSSPVAPFIADVFGRKTIVFMTDVLFILGALWQSFSSSVSSVIVGRAIVGVAIGAAAFVIPLYISELAPGRFRGRLVIIYSLFLTGGQVIAYLVGWFLSDVARGWRLMVGLGAAPAVFQLFTLLLIPETPRWLIRAGNPEDAQKVLRKMYSGARNLDVVVKRLAKRIETELAAEQVTTVRTDPIAKSSRWSGHSAVLQSFSTLLRIGGNRRALIIACMLQGGQQLVGFNSLMYFSATIFALLRFSSPTLTSLSIALANFVFTVAAFYTIDRLGRRLSLLLSIPFMAIALAFCAVAFHFSDLEVSSIDNHSTTSSLMASTSGPESMFWPLLILASTIVYTAAYAIGLGCVPWQQSELFPLQVRAVGTGIATATNWGANFLVGLTFLPLMESITPTGTFAIYTSICLATWCAIWTIYPETARLNLEDANLLLAQGWGVEESMRRWRAHPSQSTPQVDPRASLEDDVEDDG